MNTVPITLRVNGRPVAASVTPNRPLVEVLRDEGRSMDVKVGCGEGVCGTCTVLLDGDPINSCLVFAVQADGAEITTVQGLTDPDEGLHPLKRAFAEHGAAQCGFCTPGMVLTAEWHLRRKRGASRDEIREWLKGNLCRCTGYTKIVDAIESYDRQMEESDV